MTKAVDERQNIMERVAKSILMIISLLFAPLANGQIQMDLTGDGRGDSGFRTQWEPTQNRLLAYRDISSPNIPSARMFGKNGQSTPIFILRDFPDARFADVWAAAATPGGGAVLSVVLGFGDRPTPKSVSSRPVPQAKVLLLTYGPDGALKKVWNVAPYIHQALAVDLAGNIFALGTRDAGPGGFPMLIKYSPSGSVLGEYIPSKMFAAGTKALDPSPLNGTPVLLIRNQRLILWIPSTREVFRFSLNGELQRKVAVGHELDQLAIKNGFISATVAGLALAESGELVVQVLLWQSSTSTQGAVRAIATISADTQGAKLVGSPESFGISRKQFLGVADDGSPVMLEHDGKGHGMVRKE
jgi:hypothetical protein